MKYFKVERPYSSNFVIYRAHNINTLVNRLYKGKRLVGVYQTKGHDGKDMFVAYRRQSEWSRGIDTYYIREILKENVDYRYIARPRI